MFWEALKGHFVVSLGLTIAVTLSFTMVIVANLHQFSFITKKEKPKGVK